MLHIGSHPICGIDILYIPPLSYSAYRIASYMRSRSDKMKRMSMPHIGCDPICGTQYFLLYPISLISLSSPSHLHLSSFHHIHTHPLSSRQDRSIYMNFEDVNNLHRLIVRGYNSWVHNAPPSWKKDTFIASNSPILITSRYGQNASIALPNNQHNEADAWDRERDYSNVAFLTVALATSIQYASLFFPQLSYHLISPITPPHRKMLSHT
jgi:hypothetical protein